MDPIYPWLDPVEVRRLAEGLMRPQREPQVSLTDAGFDDEFVGYASSQQPLPPVQQPLPPVQSAAATSGTPPPLQHPSPPPPLVEQAPPARMADSPSESGASIARGPFLDRITRFRDWMRQQFGATDIFILDREGAVIFDESRHGRLHFLARSLAHASRRQGASARNVHVKIGADATLEVIPVDTPYGCLVLGAVIPNSLPPASVAAVMDALSQVASPPHNTP